MVDRQAELRSSDEAATLPPNRGIHRTKTATIRQESRIGCTKCTRRARRRMRRVNPPKGRESA